MSDRIQYVQALAKQLATNVNEAFTVFMQKNQPGTSAQQNALHLDQFAMACMALQEGFEILAQRSTSAAEELLDDEPD